MIITQPAAEYFRITLYVKRSPVPLENPNAALTESEATDTSGFEQILVLLGTRLYDSRQRLLAKGKEDIFSLDKVPQSS